MRAKNALLEKTRRELTGYVLNPVQAAVVSESPRFVGERVNVLIETLGYDVASSAEARQILGTRSAPAP